VAEERRDQETLTNLPVELTSFVGRKRELEELEKLLAQTRVCTITGPGGSGKTRLAIRLAGRVGALYPEGVWFLEFGNVADPALFVQQLALSLDLRESPGRDLLSALSTHLAKKRMLFVFDGCEHLVEAAAQVVDQLLRACPQLAFLVTSQEALNVPGEVAWRIPSLSVPVPESLDFERLRDSEAVRLFVERARLVSSGFDLTPALAPTVGEICRRLDGLPLAIELAAARVRVMPVEDVLRRLEDRFRLLTGGSRTAMARQQTLRATVDWSYQQLGPAEQVLFRRLSVFSGSFALDAAEAICGDDLNGSERTLEVLSGLVDRSLVVPNTTQVPARYRLLETLRQYGQERLRDSGDDDVRRRHAEYFVELAEEAEANFTELEQSGWFDRMELDHDNLRSALAWSAAQDQQLALRLVGALGRYWYMSGYVSEVREWLNVTLSGTPPSSKVLARALLTAGLAALWWGDYRLSAQYSERALEIARREGESTEVGSAANQMGMAAHFGGDYPTAARFYQEALALRSKMGDRSGAARSLNNLGLVVYGTGRLDEAEKLLSESLAMLDKVQDRRSRATVLDSLARVKLEQGDLEAARLLFAECLGIGNQLGERLTVGDGLEGLARLATKTGNHRRALVLAGAAGKLRERTGYRQPEAWAMRFDTDIEKSRSHLEKDAAVAAWSEGFGLSVSDAVDVALNGNDSTGGGLKQNDLLTDREFQVATLIVGGLSNRQIALHLHVSERTVDAHVEHIRNKLGLHSRAQIAVWVSKLEPGDHAPLRSGHET